MALQRQGCGNRGTTEATVALQRHYRGNCGNWHYRHRAKSQDCFKVTGATVALQRVVKVPSAMTRGGIFLYFAESQNCSYPDLCFWFDFFGVLRKDENLEYLVLFFDFLIFGV